MQVFTSHTVPDPIIHNAADSCEDLSTALQATHEGMMTVFELLEWIEGDAAEGTLAKMRARTASNQLHILDERLRGHADMAYAIYQKIAADGGEALSIPAEQFNALNGGEPKKPVDGDPAEVFEQYSAWMRSADENDAQAVGDYFNNNKIPSRSTIKRHMDRIRWREAVEAFEREIAAEKNMNATLGHSDQQIDDQADRTMVAYHTMLGIRAPDLKEAHRKLMHMRDFENGSPSGIAWQSIVADMEAITLAA